MKLTLSVDEQIAAQARLVVQAMGKSLNQLVREYPERLAGRATVEAARPDYFWCTCHQSLCRIGFRRPPAPQEPAILGRSFGGLRCRAAHGSSVVHPAMAGLASSPYGCGPTGGRSDEGSFLREIGRLERVILVFISVLDRYQ